MTKQDISPKTVQNFSPRRSSRTLAKNYVRGQNDVTAIQKKERNSTNKARRALVYRQKRNKKKAIKRKAERKRQQEEYAFLEQELSSAVIEWTPQRVEKLATKMQQLIELCGKAHPDADGFWYAEELKDIMDRHNVQEFNYSGPAAFLTELANFVIKSIKFENHYLQGHTTWEFRKSVVDAFSEYMAYFDESPDKEQYTNWLTEVLVRCNVNVDEELYVDNIAMDDLVTIKNFCTKTLQGYIASVKRKAIAIKADLKRKQRRQYMQKYRKKKALEEEKPPTPKIVINRHQGGIIPKHRPMMVIPGFEADSEPEMEEPPKQTYVDSDSDSDDDIGLCGFAEESKTTDNNAWANLASSPSPRAGKMEPEMYSEFFN